MLRVCLSGWEEQYYLLRQYLPTKLIPLCDTLEQIKKVQATKISDSDTSKPGDKGGTNKKTWFSENLKCRKGDGHKVYHISKKAHNEHSVSAGRNVTGPIRPITLRNATYMPKMAWHNLCTLQNENACIMSAAVMQRKDAKSSLSSKQRWLTSRLRLNATAKRSASNEHTKRSNM